MFIPIDKLALKAMMTFIVNNSPGWLDGIDLAPRSAGLAGFSAFIAASQPVENLKTT